MLPDLAAVLAAPPFNAIPPPLGGPGGLLQTLPARRTAAGRPRLLHAADERDGNFPAEFGGGRLPQVLADP